MAFQSNAINTLTFKNNKKRLTSACFSSNKLFFPPWQSVARAGRRRKQTKAKTRRPSHPSFAFPWLDGTLDRMLADQPSGGRTGGVYIPPFKLAQLHQLQQADAARANQADSVDNQKKTWEALRKSLNGLINKINVGNIKNIIPELFSENLIRGRGLLARAIMKAQLASPGFTHIYASLIAVINTKLPEIGELVVKRVVYGFKRAYKRRDKLSAIALAKFIAHLVNHQVAHELLALQLLTVLLEEPTDDSVEIAVGFVKEVGQLLDQLSPQGVHAIFERFRGILHEGEIDKRVQYTIEGLFAIRKSGFRDYPAIPEELDLVEREDQITFEIGLDDDIDKEEMLDIFRPDPKYLENEKLWDAIRAEILGEVDEEEEEEEEGGGGEQENENGEGEESALVPIDNNKTLDLTEQDLVNLRRSIYLTIMSSISYEECCHKLVKLNIPDGYEKELCNMLVECCSNERSYLRYYGLMGQRFCTMHRKYQEAFDSVFLDQYTTIHRLETNKLRNVAKFFAQLLGTDSLPWTCFEYIKLNEYDTTSSSRIFIKVLCQELAEHMGLQTLKDRFSDVYMQEVFSGIFPTDQARNTRFAINFFTSIGLGGLTDGLREHLKNAPKLLAMQMQLQQQLHEAEAESDSDSSDSSSSSSSGSSSSSSSSSDSSSDSDSDSDSSTSSSSSSSSSGSDSSSSSSSSSSVSVQKTKTRKTGRSSPPAKIQTLTADTVRGLPDRKASSSDRPPSPLSPPRRSEQSAIKRRGDSRSVSPPRRGRTSSPSPPRQSKRSVQNEAANDDDRSVPRSPSRSPSPPRRPLSDALPVERAARKRSASNSPPRRETRGRERSLSASPPRRPAVNESQPASTRVRDASEERDRRGRRDELRRSGSPKASSPQWKRQRRSPSPRRFDRRENGNGGREYRDDNTGDRDDNRKRRNDSRDRFNGRREDNRGRRADSRERRRRDDSRSPPRRAQ
eukprot:scaffold1182_cov229-Ochromonas_danica.AAC.5